MIKQFQIALLLLLTIGLSTGCGNKSLDSGAFNTAEPGLKRLWDQAVAADKANDYLTAAINYRQLRAQQDRLSADQLLAVKDASLALNQRITTAADAGDPAAKEAMKKLLAAQNRP